MPTYLSIYTHTYIYVSGGGIMCMSLHIYIYISISYKELKSMSPVVALGEVRMALSTPTAGLPNYVSLGGIFVWLKHEQEESKSIITYLQKEMF